MRHFLIFSLILFSQTLVLSQTGKPFEACVSAGIGLPKIPISQYRSPISLLAGVDVTAKLTQKIGIQAGGYGLTTISMGTVNNAEDNLNYDLMWTSMSLLYQLRGAMQDRSMLILGGGYYKLDQQFDLRRDKLTTAGFNLGLSHIMTHRKFSGKLEFRWHLLFKPSDNPQILTITYGILM